MLQDIQYAWRTILRARGFAFAGGHTIPAAALAAALAQRSQG